jgi:hypothetical protein
VVHRAGSEKLIAIAALVVGNAVCGRVISRTDNKARASMSGLCSTRQTLRLRGPNKPAFGALDLEQIGHHLGLGLLPRFDRKGSLVVAFGVERAVERGDQRTKT